MRGLLTIVMTAAVALFLSWRLTTPALNVTATTMTVDYSSFRYQPVNYGPGDLLTYGFHAFLSFEHPVISDTQFLNARALNLDNGTVDWIVQNIPIEPEAEPRPIHYRMDTRNIGLTGSPELTVLEVKMGEYQISGDFEHDTSLTLVGEPMEHHVHSGSFHDHSDVKIAYFGPIYIPPIFPETLFIVNRGCEVPNIDLDSLVHNDTDNDTINDSDWDACGPAASANSLKWLMNVHDEIPQADSLRGILDTLKKLMYKNDSLGVRWDSLVSGKLAFIDKHKLPIRVKYQVHSPYPGYKAEIKSPNKIYRHKAVNQTGESGIPDFEWICSELANGEDVEVGIAYWCPAPGNPDSMVQRGGHYVNLTGYALVGNEPWLMWKHDLWQQTPEGLVEEWGKMSKAKKPTDTSENPQLYPMLGSLSESDDGCIAFIGSVVSESYDPTIIFCPDKVCIPDDDGPGSLREALACAQDGAVVTLGPELVGDTVHITSSQLEINTSIQLVASAPGITVKFDTGSGFVVDQSSGVLMEGFDVIGGTGSDGSAVLNNGTLTLHNVNVYRREEPPNTGNLIKNAGQMHITGETNLNKD